MDGSDPVGGQWNYDSENRQPPKSDLEIPKPYSSIPDAISQEVIEIGLK